ncbi:MAG TPA: hypothetical protein VKZ63_09425 [Kofleriaceae bacterium]|nr:hypothetical protein [Kofleriaceae bacterium]
MNLVKKQLPLLIGMAVGVLVLAEFYVPASWLDVTREELLTFAQILAAAAFVLGGVNLIQVNYPKIRRREEDWQYKVVLLAGAAIMFAVGFPWQDIGENPSPGQVTVVDGAAAASGGAALLRVEATRDNALVKVDGGSPQRAVVDGRPLELELQPGAHTIHVYMPAVGYGELRTELEVAAGQTAVARAELPMLWGPSGRVRTWLYNYVFFPCQATMFSLLAFFIASAAFRAFRARNTEAALLLGAAIIVLLGRAPIGRFIYDALPEITNWIIDVPNNAGRRAIMMGAALGGIVTGLRVILGLERSHLGSE